MCQQNLLAHCRNAEIKLSILFDVSHDYFSQLFLHSVVMLTNVYDTGSRNGPKGNADEILEPVEGGNQRDGDAAVRVHLPSQEDVLG